MKEPATFTVWNRWVRNFSFQCMSLCMSLWVLLWTLGLASTAHGAPFPATSSSLLVSSQRSLFISPLGFQLHRGESDWILVEPTPDSEGAVTHFVPPHAAGETRLSIRTEQLDPLAPSSRDLTNYIKKFIKNYRQFDFEIIAKRPFHHHGEKAFVIDLQTTQKGLQLRQAIFFRESKVVILTCRDHISHFKTTLKSCNEIIRSFRWRAE